MASITKRTKADGSIVYKAEIVIKQHGKIVHRESKTFDRQRLAKDWGMRREVELQESEVYTRKAYLPIGDVIRQYMNEFPPTGRSKNFDLTKLLERDIAKLNVHKLTAKDLIKHIRERNKECKPQTAANDLIWLGVVLKTMKGIIDIDIDLSIFDSAREVLRSERLIGRSEHRERRPTKEEIWKLARYFGKDSIMLRLMYFAIYSARRQSEITRIEWDDIDHERRTCLIRYLKDPRKKGVKKRFKIPNSAYKIIMKQPKVSRYVFPELESKTIGAYFTRACKILGIEDLHWHDLRHHSASLLFEKGLTIQQVQLITLHSNWSTLSRYCNLDPSSLDI
jgi:integrase